MGIKSQAELLGLVNTILRHHHHPMDAQDVDVHPILDWHNKQIEEVLDRLEKHKTTFKLEARNEFGVPQDLSIANVIPSSAIEAERKRLKSGNERLKALNITKAEIEEVDTFGDPPNKLKENE